MCEGDGLLILGQPTITSWNHQQVFDECLNGVDSIATVYLFIHNETPNMIDIASGGLMSQESYYLSCDRSM